MFQLAVVELVLAYVAGLLTIPAMLIVFILFTEEQPVSGPISNKGER